MSDPVYITDHVERARELLTHDLSDKPNVDAVLVASVSEVQSLEDALYELTIQRRIETAQGAMLDQLGAIVGEPRAGLADDDYRRFVQARVETNIGEGEITRLISVLKTITGADVVHYQTTPPANFSVAYVVDSPLSTSLRARIVAQVVELTPAGVGFEVVESPTGFFGFQGNPRALGFDAGKLSSIIS